MKKFASIILCLLLIVSTAIVAVSAVDYSTETTNVGSLRIWKNNATKDVNATGVSGAGFTVNKIMDYDSTSNTFSIRAPYLTYDSTSETYGGTLADYIPNLTKTSSSASPTGGYVNYGDVTVLETYISSLATDAASATDGKTATTNTHGMASFTKMTYGLYLVRETTVPSGYTAASSPFLVAILNDTPVDAAPKNNKIEIGKKLVSQDESEGTVTSKPGLDDDSYAIGDTVTYRINSLVPTYDDKKLEGVATDKVILKFADTLSSGLTLTPGTIKVWVSKDSTTTEITSNTTIKTSGTDPSTASFTVEVPLSAVKSNTVNYFGWTIYVTYDAVLNPNAQVTTGNSNAVTLYYRNDPSDTTFQDEDVPEEEQPKVYTYQFELTKKLDGETITNTTAAAAYQNIDFTLNDGTNNISVTQSTVGHYTVCAAGTAGATTTLKLGTTATDYGKLEVKGLKAGTYTLTEGGTSTGYTLLSSPVTIVVNEDANIAGAVDATITDGEGNTKQLAVSITNPAYDPNNHDSNEPETIPSGRFALEINNPSSQFNLPTTGGYGILIFTLGAAVVLALAIVIFTVARKKKKD